MPLELLRKHQQICSKFGNKNNWEHTDGLVCGADMWIIWMRGISKDLLPAHMYFTQKSQEKGKRIVLDKIKIMNKQIQSNEV